MNDTVISTKQASELTGFHTDTIALWLRLNLVRGLLADREWKISKESLLDYVSKLKGNSADSGGVWVETADICYEIGYDAYYLAELCRRGVLSGVKRQGYRNRLVWFVEIGNLEKVLKVKIGSEWKKKAA
jgi:hypothetical protein